MNADITEASEACSSLDVVLGSFVTSWMSHLFSLVVILVGRPLLGKFTTVPIFLPCVDNGSHSGSLESRRLRNGFVTLSRLIDVDDFVSHPLGNFFRLQHGVLLEISQPTSLCQKRFYFVIS